MTTFTQDQWMILALVFVLGLLVGAFLTAGGRSGSRIASGNMPTAKSTGPHRKRNGANATAFVRPQ
jgi:hypothetical protein